MSLLWPWSLLALTAVAAAAIWALLRPARQLEVVGSLSLWREALDSLDRRLRRRSRRISWSWLALLAGAVAAVLGAARPVYHARLPARRLAVAVCPSIELSAARGDDALRPAVEALLRRFGPHDRVRLLRATDAGGGVWLSRDEAIRRLDDVLQILPFAAKECDFAPWPAEAQHVYVFVPAGREVPAGPNVSVVRIPSRLAPVTIDALAAVEGDAGTAQVFLAARNQTDQPQSVRVSRRTLGPPARGGSIADGETRTIRPGGREGFVLALPSSPAILVQLHPAAGGLGAAGCLVRSEIPARKVVLLGRDCPEIRRFLAVHPALTLIGEPGQADVAICIGRQAPADKPALVIAPPGAPPGWSAEPSRGPWELKDASLAGDDAVMRHVDLAAVAVRRAAAWRRTEAIGQKVLLARGDEALILRNEPEEFPAAGRPPRRIYLSFDVAAENTNLSNTPAFVIFMANAMQWLSPRGQGPSGRTATTFGFSPPAVLTALGEKDVEYLPCDAADSTWRPASPPNGFAAGLYRTPGDGSAMTAVSLVGLQGGRLDVPPAQAVAALPLPPPQPWRQPMEFWPALLCAAVALWLAGWYLRVV